MAVEQEGLGFAREHGTNKLWTINNLGTSDDRRTGRLALYLNHLRHLRNDRSRYHRTECYKTAEIPGQPFSRLDHSVDKQSSPRVKRDPARGNHSRHSYRLPQNVSRGRMVPTLCPRCLAMKQVYTYGGQGVSARAIWASPRRVRLDRFTSSGVTTCANTILLSCWREEESHRDFPLNRPVTWGSWSKVVTRRPAVCGDQLVLTRVSQGSTMTRVSGLVL